MNGEAEIHIDFEGKHSQGNNIQATSSRCDNIKPDLTEMYSETKNK
jgi:hypothetical protein